MNYITERNKLLIALNALESQYSKHIGCPTDILSALKKYTNKSTEHFVVITLNGSYDLIKVTCITKGLLNRTLVHPREVYRQAIIDNAAAIIVAHNHPSGNVNPSSEDKTVTNNLKKAGQILGIELLDHLIISKNSYYSFIENHLI